MRLNLLLLLFISFLPFPTRLVAGYIGQDKAERVAVKASPALEPERSTGARTPSQVIWCNFALSSTTFIGDPAHGQTRRRIAPLIVVDPGFMVD